MQIAKSTFALKHSRNVWDLLSSVQPTLRAIGTRLILLLYILRVPSRNHFRLHFLQPYLCNLLIMFYSSDSWRWNWNCGKDMPMTSLQKFGQQSVNKHINARNSWNRHSVKSTAPAPDHQFKMSIGLWFSKLESTIGPKTQCWALAWNWMHVTPFTSHWPKMTSPLALQLLIWMLPVPARRNCPGFGPLTKE